MALRKQHCPSADQFQHFLGQCTVKPSCHTVTVHLVDVWTFRYSIAILFEQVPFDQAQGTPTFQLLLLPHPNFVSSFALADFLRSCWVLLEWCFACGVLKFCFRFPPCALSTNPKSLAASSFPEFEVPVLLPVFDYWKKSI